MTKAIKVIGRYFSAGEWALWLVSVILIAGPFIIFDRQGYLTLFASVLGVTAILINAKGNPLGQLMMAVFGAIYTVISYSCAYYGEMITYLGMTTPMALFSFASWLKNPYKGKRTEVEVNVISNREKAFMLILTVIVTVGFYYILRAFGTANIVPSTVSVATSFVAVYLTFRRSALFSLAYALNDIVLIVLWIMAGDTAYLSVVMCFVAFLANDIYSYVSWQKMHKRQIMG